MIQRVRFDGYRLLDEFEADLGQLTVVIGANATGKSTLLDALSLVTNGMELPIEDAVAFRGGMWSIPNAGRDCDEIGWRLTFVKPSHHPVWSRIPLANDTPCVYEARLGRDRFGKMTLRSEHLEQPRHGKQSLKILELESGTAKIFNPKTRKLFPFDQPAEPPTAPNSTDGRSPFAEPPAQKPSLLLARMRFEHEFPLPTWVRGYFASFCYYPGFEVSRSSPVRNTPAEIRPTPTLNANGENLGTVLHEFLTRQDLRGQASELRDFLRAAYPEVEDVFAETAFGGEPRVLVRLKETGLRRATEIWELSDGMLRFLLLCCALLNPLPGLIAIDEPETGLHPRLLPIVADVIRSAAEQSQVLITTHSPQLLTAFSLDDIAVLTREAARAAWFRPRERDTLRRMLESQVGGTLGDLHSSGELEALA
jgi:predicted ATPase